MAIYIPSIRIAAELLVDSYQTNDYTRIKEIMDYVVNTPTISGSADEYHNASVKLTRIDDYENAVIILEQGLKRFPRSTDILADLLLYGVKCRKISSISHFYYDNLAKIDKDFWTWRSFHFSIDFLMLYIQYAETREQRKAIDSEIVSLITNYKKYKPRDERAYMVEHDYYELIHCEDKAISALKNAVEKLTVCPQCALNYADYLFESGQYSAVIPIVEKAINIREDQPSINLGYAYYISALSREYVLRSDNTTFNYDNTKPVFDSYFSALEYLDNDQSHLAKQIEKRVRILERESGVESKIEFKSSPNASLSALSNLLRNLPSSERG